MLGNETTALDAKRVVCVCVSRLTVAAAGRLLLDHFFSPFAALSSGT